MRSALGWTWKALVVLACLAYQYWVHASIGDARGGLLHAVLLWLPLLFLAGWVAARSRNRPLWLAALAAVAGVVYLAENQERLGLAAVSGISHAAAYLFLLWYFGHTLAGGREPIITRFARKLHGALQPEMGLFTRRLTIVWCAFFAAQLLASVALFMLAPLQAWSLFVNLFNLPLLAIMFTVQWTYRRLRHPDCPRASVWQAVAAFAEDASLSGSAELR